MTESQTIFIIDDDPNLCDSLRFLFESVQLNVETYLHAQDFLDQYDADKLGCIIVDVHMPIVSGLDVLEFLRAQKKRLPAIVVTDQADIPMAIRAMKLGAIDFILKPFDPQVLLDTVQRCFEQSPNVAKDEYVMRCIQSLTNRERQVLNLVCEGKLNKEIAYELSISMSTVEAHRANIMRKLRVKNLAQLIKIYLKYEMINIEVIH